MRRYQCIIVYDDFACKTECVDDIVPALQAAAIYLYDSSCIIVEIWDNKTEKFVLDFTR